MSTQPAPFILAMQHALQSAIGVYDKLRDAEEENAKLAKTNGDQLDDLAEAKARILELEETLSFFARGGGSVDGPGLTVARATLLGLGASPEREVDERWAQSIYATRAA